MILVDTSIWIDHFRHRSSELSMLLENGDVATHPFIIGEIACGNLKSRQVILRYLSHLPQSPVATSDEVLHFIEQNRLAGRGIGFVDVHLLASVILDPGTRLWTSDRMLEQIAVECGISHMTKKPGA